VPACTALGGYPAVAATALRVGPAPGSAAVQDDRIGDAEEDKNGVATLAQPGSAPLGRVRP
jgi:hypothetical protein